MDSWQKQFLDKLGRAQSVWLTQFEQSMEEHVKPAFEQLSSFVRENGFKVSTPLHDDGRRSYKFELAENAYMLLIFRFSGLGEFELRSESFAPGSEPALNKSLVRVADVNRDWSDRQFQSALDGFVDLLSGSKFTKAEPPLALV